MLLFIVKVKRLGYPYAKKNYIKGFYSFGALTLDLYYFQAAYITHFLTDNFHLGYEHVQLLDH